MPDLMPMKITEFIDDVYSIDSDKAEMIESVRVLFRKAGQTISEEIKYGGLVFLKSGILIGGVFPYKKHISIEFSNGAEFTDPQALLEGKGNIRRHLKIYNIQDLVLKNAIFFIEQSVYGDSNG